MKMKKSALLAALLIVLSAPVLSRQPDVAAAQVLAADTASTTVSGHSFMAPAGWTLQRKGAAVILIAPEGGSTIALVDVTVTNADAAVAAAWQTVAAQVKWPLKLATDRPARNGWEPSKAYDYDVAASQRRTVSALAMPYKGAWTVMLYDMADDVGDKRSAQVRLVMERLQPKGYQRESFADKTAHKLDAVRLATLRGFIEDARQQLDIPGVAIGIVQDGKVVLAEGFGIRTLGKPEKVDADTRFMIASNTKALTTLMLSKLVEQGRFGWDTPVTQLLPTFKLGDADTTRKVLVKHLICACTGLPRQDYEFLFEGETLSPATVTASLATMQPTTRFGELFQYSNTMAAVAGFAAGHALYPDKELGAAYDEAMQTLVFAPLDMRATTFDFAQAQRGDHASPHATDLAGRTVVADMGINHSVIPARPAGAAWSTVNDMLRYVQMELDQGRLADGQRYIGEAVLLERRKPQVAIGDNASYGMGLMVRGSTGTPVVNHGGDLTGFHSDMLWLPEHNVGAVILTNADAGTYLRGPFQRRLLEVLFDGKPEAAEGVTSRAALIKQQAKAERERLVTPADPALAGKLAARYAHPALGTIVISRQDARTWFDFGGWKSEVATRRSDDGSVAFVTISPGVGGFELLQGDQAGRATLTLRDAQHEYVFEPTAAAGAVGKTGR